MYQVYRIDEDGYYIETVVVEGDIIPIDPDIVHDTPPEGLFHPRWIDDAWVEGLTPQQIADRLATPAPEQDAVKIARLESELAIATNNNFIALEALTEIYEMMLLMQEGGT